MESLLRLSGKLSAATLNRRRISCTWSLRINVTFGTGLLGDDDNGATDLGALEKKLAEKAGSTRFDSAAPPSNPTSPSQGTSGHDGNASTPHSSLASPEPYKPDRPEKDIEKRKSHTPGEQEKEKENEKDGESGEKQEEEVEALSEMMCSLVTNSQGETRYIGESGSSLRFRHVICARSTRSPNCALQALPRDTPSSRPRASNG